MRFLVGFVGLCLVALGGCANQAVMSETSETQVTVSDSSTEVVSVPEDFQNFIMRGDKICAMSTPPAEFSTVGNYPRPWADIGVTLYPLSTSLP